MEALVVKSTGNEYILRTNDGKIIIASLKGNFRIKDLKSTNPIAVGDRVKYESINNDFWITNIMERKNYIIRKSKNLSKKIHIIASNIDLLMIIVSMKMPKTPLGFIDRFLLTAEAYGVPAMIVFNKYDIYKEKEILEMQELFELYNSMGYKCIYASATENINTNLIIDELKDKTNLIAGASGVGKSSLINVIQPHLNLKTANISNFNEKGKHTTSFAEMYPLTFGGNIIDTPGIRSFGILNFKLPEIAHFFPDMKKYINNCKYSNCIHMYEPNCAIIEALDKGEIKASRYASYLSIIQEFEEAGIDYKYD
ncbi:MAG: ribosome small subunit-dependent GTPase A [Bacteroidetes bacterium GWF2_29_10]|nr:MAG: ribosome small subunit-dependent GTPase A [Bacteroidetes bacterium GWF2_29_10]